MPSYLIWGEEEFNIDKRLKEIKKSVLNDNITPLNYKKIDNPTPEKLDEILRTQGMMFGDILFVINADKYFMNVKKPITLTDKQGDELVESIKNLSPTIHVIFVCKIEKDSGKKPDSRKKLYKALSKYGKIEEYPIFKYYETQKAMNWVQKRAQAYKLKMTFTQAEKIVNGVGMFLRDLDNSLEKLSLLAHPKNVVTDDMLDALTNENSTVYDILDLVINGKKQEALYKIALFLEKQNQLSLLSFLQVAITKLILTKIYLKKYSTFDVARKIGAQEFIVKQNAAKVQNITLKSLVKLKQELTEIEFKIKTGEISDLMLGFGVLFNKGGIYE